MEFQKTDARALGSFYLSTLQRLGIKTKVNMRHLDRYIATYGLKYVDIAIIGSNPSVASPDNTPFHKGTKSRKTIDSWFTDADFDYHLSFYNIVNYKKTNNKRLTKSEINEHLPKISKRFNHMVRSKLLVAVGQDAQYALDKADIPHFKMPHPSGLNRFWNDPELGQAKIQEMIEWLKTSNSQRVKRLQDLLVNRT